MGRIVVAVLLSAVALGQTIQLSVPVGSPTQAAALMSLLTDVEIHGDHADVLIHAPSEMLALQAAGFSPTIEIQDVEAFYRSRLVQPPVTSDGSVPQFGQGSLGGYFTDAEMYAFMQALSAQYPAIVAPAVSIGFTAESRPIWMWKISDNPLADEPEPEVLFDGLLHAREPMSMEAICYFAQRLCEGYGANPRTTALVDEREIYLVPMVNVDGYVYNTTATPFGGGIWRKNRRVLPDTNVGVDLNRNYADAWGIDDVGSSGATSSYQYRGATPFSEPETLAMKAFCESRDFSTGLSLHTFGNLVLIPPSHTAGAVPPAPWQARYEGFAATMSAMGPGFIAGYSWQVLYLANGTSIDWAASTLYGGNQMLAFTCELGSTFDGFWPATSRIIPIANDAMELMEYVTAIAGPSLRTLGADVLEPSGTTPFLWEPGETLAVVAQVRNDGRASAAATLRVETSDPWLTVPASPLALGAIAEFGGVASNALSPLTVQVDPATPLGTQISFDVVAEAPGSPPSRVTVTGIVGSPAGLVLVDDCEQDHGWQVGAPGDTATSGLWTRADPNGTLMQQHLFNPEDDHTPGSGTQCWFTGQGVVGGPVGAQDVDGTTTLTSPVFNLSAVSHPTISYWRWFATTGTDSLTVELSNDDGANWVQVEQVTGNQAVWTLHAFVVEAILPRTSTMRLRFRASDQPNNSLCEAAIDDVRIDAWPPLVELTVPAVAPIGVGTSMAIAAPLAPSQWYVVGVSETAHAGILVSGVLVPIDPGPLLEFVFTVPEVFTGFVGTLDAQGQATATLNVPNVPFLSGLQLFAAAAVADSSVTVLGASGATRITIQ